MNFNSVNAMYSEVQKQLGIALKNAMDKGVELAKQYIQDKWYGTYQPRFYNRTLAILDCIEVDYTLNNGHFNARLYIKDEKHPKSNSWTDRTFEEIAEWFAEGAYGRDEGYDVIEYTKEQLIDVGVALNIIKDALAKAGFKIN